MTDLLIVTQDQALHAIRQHIAAPDTHPVLRAVVDAVLAVHVIDPPDESGGPWKDCADCDGSGWVVHVFEDGVNRRHCHCPCPWCAGCDEALCGGLCPTVAGVARALGLIPTALTKESDRA